MTMLSTPKQFAGISMGTSMLCDTNYSHIDSHKTIGDKVVLIVNRHGQIMNLNLMLQARPPSVRNATSLE